MDVYWLARTAADVPLDDDWLSGRERAVLSRMRQTKRREDWRLGRWTAKTALAVRLEIGGAPEVLAGIEVSAEHSGAPIVIRWKKRTPHVISLSHSHELAFCCLSEAGTLLGCDVEWVEPRSPAFTAEYFTAAEQSQAPTGDCFCRHAVVNAMWSAKESVLKALGCGLHVDALRLAVNLAPVAMEKDWKPLTVCVGGGCSFEGWWRVDGGFAWTLVSFPASPPPLPL